MKGPVVSRRKAIAGLAGAGSALGVSLAPALARTSTDHRALLLVDARQTDPATLAMVKQLFGTGPYTTLEQEPVRAWRDGLEASVRKAGTTHVIGRWDAIYVLSMLGREASFGTHVRQLQQSTFCLTLLAQA